MWYHAIVFVDRICLQRIVVVSSMYLSIDTDMFQPRQPFICWDANYAIWPLPQNPIHHVNIKDITFRLL